MTSRNALAALAPLLVVAAACGGGVVEPPTRSPAPSSARPGGDAYDPDQLAQALLTEIPGYEPSGPVQRGPYTSLTAMADLADAQQAAKLDKPQCASQMVPTEPAIRYAPSAMAEFGRGGQIVTETLMAVGPQAAAREVALRVSGACRSFRVQVAGRWGTATIAETSGTRIGEESRSVGSTVTLGSASLRTWYVVLRSRGYLAAIRLQAPGATRGAAERLARLAYQQAERTLP